MTGNASKALTNSIRLLGGGLLMLPGVALAHPGHDVAGGAVHGLMHPFTGLDHALAMLLVGIFAYQRGGRALWSLPLAFLVAMAVGGILGFATPTSAMVEVVIALSVVVLGAAVALNVKTQTAVAAAVVALFAIFHGFAHGSEIPAASGALPYAGGFLLGSSILMAIGIGSGAALNNAIAGRGVAQVMRSAGAVAAIVGVGLLTGIA